MRSVRRGASEPAGLPGDVLVLLVRGAVVVRGAVATVRRAVATGSATLARTCSLRDGRSGSATAAGGGTGGTGSANAHALPWPPGWLMSDGASRHPETAKTAACRKTRARVGPAPQSRGRSRRRGCLRGGAGTLRLRAYGPR